MGRPSVAAGLWGDLDFPQMSSAVEELSDFVDIRFTKAPGITRENITIIDKACCREMHLRSESSLAASEPLSRLKSDLLNLINRHSVCVFAGSIPDGVSEEIICIVEAVKKAGAKIVVDTSGRPLREIVAAGGIEILKPNLSELCQLTGRKINDDTDEIAKSVKPLLKKAKIIAVTRGENGAVVVTQEHILEGRCATENKVISTVGCGDYFLAGFLCGKNLEDSLPKALKAAAARAWQDRRNWKALEEETAVKIQNNRLNS